MKELLENYSCFFIYKYEYLWYFDWNLGFTRHDMRYFNFFVYFFIYFTIVFRKFVRFTNKCMENCILFMCFTIILFRKFVGSYNSSWDQSGYETWLDYLCQPHQEEISECYNFCSGWFYWKGFPRIVDGGGWALSHLLI